MKVYLSVVLLALLGLALIAAPGTSAEKVRYNEKVVETPRGKFVLKYLDLAAGKGREVRRGDQVEVHYTGTLTNGRKFDCSRERHKPFTTFIGGGVVIKGWDEGIPGMKAGGRRRLIIPPELAYGHKDIGNGLVPGDSTLIFDVEIVKVK